MNEPPVDHPGLILLDALDAKPRPGARPRRGGRRGAHGSAEGAGTGALSGVTEGVAWGAPCPLGAGGCERFAPGCASSSRRKRCAVNAKEPPCFFETTSKVARASSSFFIF